MPGQSQNGCLAGRVSGIIIIIIIMYFNNSLIIIIIIEFMVVTSEALEMLPK